MDKLIKKTLHHSSLKEENFGCFGVFILQTSVGDCKHLNEIRSSVSANGAGNRLTKLRGSTNQHLHMGTGWVCVWAGVVPCSSLFLWPRSTGLGWEHLSTLTSSSWRTKKVIISFHHSFLHIPLLIVVPQKSCSSKTAHCAAMTLDLYLHFWGCLCS